MLLRIRAPNKKEARDDQRWYIRIRHGHVMAFGGEWVKKPEIGVRIVKGWDHDKVRAEEGAAAFADMDENTGEIVKILLNFS